MIEKPFLRKIDLTIGGNRVESNGTRETLRVAFNVTKTILGSPNSSTIDIYNIKLATRSAIAKELAEMVLMVGHENRAMSKMAVGSILSSVSERRGADIITTATFFDGYFGLVKGVSQKTFGAGYNVADIVEDLARKLPGVTVSPEKIRVSGSVGSRGRTTNGLVSNELNKLGEEYGFSWSVQNGVFQAIDDNSSFNRITEISAKAGNLFKAVPIIAGPSQERAGVEIVAKLDPAILPADKVKLISIVDPSLSGEYKIHTVVFSGDTGDSPWEMVIRSFKEF